MGLQGDFAAKGHTELSGRLRVFSVLIVMLVKGLYTFFQTQRSALKQMHFIHVSYATRRLFLKSGKLWPLRKSRTTRNSTIQYCGEDPMARGRLTAENAHGAAGTDRYRLWLQDQSFK